MFVRIAGDPARADIEEPDDCTRLHVVADGVDDATAGAVLRSCGMGAPGEPGHVWLEVAALRAAGTGADRAQRFAAMLSYATSMGWLDDTGERLAAHIERTDP